MTYRLSLRETSYLYTFLSYIVYPCQTQDDGCHIPFPVNLRREEMPRYMFRPVIMNATTIYPGTAVLHPPCPDAGFLLSPLLGQAVPVAEYVTSTTRSTPAHYMGNISMEVRCILEDTVVHHARLHTHYISIEICSNSNSDASFASRPHAYIHEQWLSPRCGCRREDRILARDICTRHHVPTRKLSTAQIRADMAGIYSSAPHKSDHDDDPGP